MLGLHGFKRHAVLLADAVAVVAVDQQIAPQHQRIAAAFGQDAALQRFVLIGAQRIDIGLEFFVDNNIHGAEMKGAAAAARWKWGGRLRADARSAHRPQALPEECARG
ncbi:hypothetical protein D3C86_1739410 [compost metagenome]